MPNETYVITPSDENPTREFSISPHTSNGTLSPISQTLHPNAVAANTSLILPGQGLSDYGAFYNENLVHILESFSSTTEPLNPIHGQIWYDENDNTAKIFDTTGIEIIDLAGNVLTVKVQGVDGKKYQSKLRDAYIARFTPGFKFKVFEITTRDLIGSFTVDSASTQGIDQTEILVTVTNSTGIPAPPIVPPFTHSIGVWSQLGPLDPQILDDVFTATIPVWANFNSPVNDLDIGGYNIINVADPVNLTDGMNLQFAEAQYVNVIGDTMIGTLIINSATALQVTGTVEITGQLNMLAGSDLAGSDIDMTSSGFIVNLLDPTDPQHAATKNYADSTFVDVSGDTMTGFLFLNANPTLALHAATKSYVDTVTGGTPSSLDDLDDVTITSPTTGSVLFFNGVEWIDSPAGTVDAGTLDGFNNTEFVRKTSGIVQTISSGRLDIADQPGQAGNPGIALGIHAATVDYVDVSITGHNDTVHPSGGVDIYVTTGSYDGGTDELTLNRTGTIGDVVVTGIAAGVGAAINNTDSITHDIAPLLAEEGDSLESFFADNPSFPSVILDIILDNMSVWMKKFSLPNESGVITSTGAATYDIDALFEFDYTGGYNNLQVFVNGQKYIASTRGFQEAGQSIPPDLFPSVATGLSNDATIFSFDISVDGGAAQTISFAGSSAQNYSLMTIEINSQLTGAYVVMISGALRFVSDTSGSTSSISITDVNLFSSLSGSVTLDTPVAGVDHDYEEVGSYSNTALTTFTFTGTPPPAGSSIEVVIINTGGITNLAGFEI